jgi:hypothetical protein
LTASENDFGERARLHPQEHGEFDHESETIDLFDCGAVGGFGDRFRCEGRRQALFGGVVFLLDGVDVHAAVREGLCDVGDDAVFIVDGEAQVLSGGFGLGGELELARLEEADYVLSAEASGGEVAGNLNLIGDHGRAGGSW